MDGYSKRHVDKIQENSLNSFDMLSDGGVDTERKTSSVDAPDFEYDEDYSSLVANQEAQDYPIEGIDDVLVDLHPDEGAQITDIVPSGFNDEDYETALGSVHDGLDALHTIPSNDCDMNTNVEDEIKKKIKTYGIVNVSGSDNHGRPVIILAACNIPTKQEIDKQKKYFKSQQDFFDNLFSVLTDTLDDYVMSDYTLLYLHYGLKSDNKPSLQWLLRVYKMLDRK